MDNGPETLNRDFAVNAHRATRNAWMREARRTSADVLPLRRVELVRKARAAHRRMIWAIAAEWY